MLEKIIYINDNEAKVAINVNAINSSNIKDLMNLHLVFDDGLHKILGEIVELDNNTAKIEFLGEFINNNFTQGIIVKPKLNTSIRSITKEELDILLSTNDNKSFSLGKAVLYNMPLNINVDELFNSHIAIFGNTGSGKSYGVTRMIQSIFYNTSNIALNSIIMLFDTHGEYDAAFRNINTINPNYRYQLYSSDLSKERSKIISLPIWLLDIEDIAYLLEANEYSQLAIIEKSLLVLSILTQKEDIANKYKNHIIAKSIQTIMYSNLPSSKIRSEVFDILRICSTKEFNLDAEIPGIGYTREFKKCFDINKTGLFAEAILIGEYIEKFIDEELEKQAFNQINKCNLKDLEDALNFVIISENIINNDKLYNSAIMLKMKLHSLIVRGYDKYFEYNDYVDINAFISNLVIENGSRIQILNLDIEGLSDHFASFITRTYSKIVFGFLKNLKNRASIPVHIFLEEAHRFIKSNKDNFLGSNIFEDIAKEGRKFGMILVLISQRPTELSETVLSQCSSFLLFRTNHPRDLEYMKKAIPNINTDIIEKQRSIQPGYLVGLGKAFKIPMIIRLDLPNPAPQSSNANIFNIWSGNRN